MKKVEVIENLCKMQGDVAGHLGLNTVCVCRAGEGIVGDNEEVPEEVITEMWRRLTHDYWFENKEEPAELPSIDSETLDKAVRDWKVPNEEL